MKILFICTGNTCRSPMAAALLNQYLEDREAEVRSAGIAAFPGESASSNAIEALKEKGIQYEHTSRRVDQELIDWADYIFTMTLSHKWYLLAEFPESKEKVFTLKEYIGGESDMDKPYEWDIQDPYGGPLEIYRDTLQEIEENILKLKEKLFPDK